MVVVLSVGHTPSDPGAVAGDLVEFEVAKKIVVEAGNILKSENIDVVIGPFDYDLRSRIEWINDSGFTAGKGDICIDVHINDGGRSGIEGWYKDRGPNDSSLLAEAVSESISNATNLPFLGAKSEYDHPFRTLAFVHNTNAISALIECGYLDNPVDSSLMRTADGIKKFAMGLVEGIKHFLQKKGITVGYKRDVMSSAAVLQQSKQTPSDQAFGGQDKQVSKTQPSFVSPLLGFSGPTNQRRELIKKLYIEVLGREADPKGISYYTSTNPDATEDQIRKEMTQSTEHFEILKNARKAKKLEERIKKMEEELNLAKSSLEAKENEISNLENLLRMKTEEMMKMSKQLQMQAGVVQNIAPTPVSSPFPMHETSPYVFPEEDRWSRRKGCLGWLKEVLGI